jgi:tRNA 2-thiouridine synthesizing protein E
MAESMSEIMNPSAAPQKDPAFPNAPTGWTKTAAEDTAAREGLTTTEDHWEAVRALQEFFGRHSEETKVNARELHDALDERFHQKGGIKYLYEIFPGGPVAQGSRIAGFEPPAGAIDPSFGSVK